MVTSYISVTTLIWIFQQDKQWYGGEQLVFIVTTSLKCLVRSFWGQIKLVEPPSVTFCSELCMLGSPSHNRCLLALFALWELPIMSIFLDCFVFACLIDAFLCLCSVHCVCILRSVFLVCAAFASAYLMRGWLCPPPCLIVLCLSLYVVFVWSVQLTALGLAGHHGRSVRCPVEVGTINERAHAPALPLPMEGISASACTQRRLFATHTPVMVRSVPFQNHKWDKKSFKWNVLQKKIKALQIELYLCL